MSKSNKIVLKGKKVYYPFVNHTRNKFESTEQEWSIDVALDENEFNKLKKMGIQKQGLKTSKDGSYTFLTFNKNVISATGKELFKPTVVDNYNRPYDGKVGNGSICDVVIDVYEYKPGKFSFKYGGLIIRELVEFSGGSGFEGLVEFDELPEDDVAPFDTEDGSDDDFDVI
jgi:hypothetical protein